MIAGGGDIIGGRAETGDDQQVAAVDEQAFDDIAAVKHQRQSFLPMRICERMTAIALSSLKARSAAMRDDLVHDASARSMR